jgi:uncharacterized protein
MNVAGQLYRLQQLDLELERKQQELDEIESRLSDNKALVAAEAEVASQKGQLEEARKRQESSEWELEDLQEKAQQIDGKLYGGKAKDPKELVNLEKEGKALRSQIKVKEDALLGLMGDVEEVEARVRTTAQEIEQLKREWEERQEALRPRRGEIEALLAELRAERNGLVQQIAPEALSIYDRIRPTRAEAVVKVERGRCLGCHITVSTSQWQKAKAGALIQCNNCGRILYVD